MKLLKTVVVEKPLDPVFGYLSDKLAARLVHAACQRPAPDHPASVHEAPSSGSSWREQPHAEHP
jgi:hypothetical protein